MTGLSDNPFTDLPSGVPTPDARCCICEQMSHTPDELRSCLNKLREKTATILRFRRYGFAQRTHGFLQVGDFADQLFHACVFLKDDARCFNRGCWQWGELNAGAIPASGYRSASRAVIDRPYSNGLLL